jgi:hypothetical protein
MHKVFNPPAEGSHAKKNWMVMSYERLCRTDSKGPFEIANNEVLTELIITLSRFFQARHVDIPATRRKRIAYIPPVTYRPPMDAAYKKETLRYLDDHEQIITTFDKSLNVAKHGMQWPEEEPAMKQDIASIGREGWYSF